jgi:Bacterial regulatory proteins, luxR family
VEACRSGSRSGSRIAAPHGRPIPIELYISDATVKTHITHILQKLNLRDRVQAVVLAHETRLSSQPTRNRQAVATNAPLAERLAP